MAHIIGFSPSISWPLSNAYNRHFSSIPLFCIYSNISCPSTFCDPESKKPTLALKKSMSGFNTVPLSCKCIANVSLIISNAFSLYPFI